MPKKSHLHGCLSRSFSGLMGAASSPAPLCLAARAARRPAAGGAGGLETTAAAGRRGRRTQGKLDRTGPRHVKNGAGHKPFKWWKFPMVKHIWNLQTRNEFCLLLPTYACGYWNHPDLTHLEQILREAPFRCEIFQQHYCH